MPKNPSTPSSHAAAKIAFSPLDHPAKLDVTASVIAFIAAIGGIGKTTTTEMTGAALAAAGAAVLWCELDQQSPLSVRNSENVHSEQPARVDPDAVEENLYLVEAQVDSIDRFLAESPDGIALYDIGANLDDVGLNGICVTSLDERLDVSGRPLLVFVLLSADPATWKPTKALLARWKAAVDHARFAFVAVDKKNVFSRGLPDSHVAELEVVLGEEIVSHGVLRMPDISGRTDVVLRAVRRPWANLAEMDPLEVAALTGHRRAGISSGNAIKDDVEALITAWRAELRRLSFRC